MFWRSFTSWMGGMGILVLMIAVIPSVKANSFHIMKAEAPGPSPEKVVPRIGQTARILYILYLSLTALQAGLLLVGGMSPYDAMINAMGTISTGGFSNHAASIGAYQNVYFEIVTGVFMLLSGVSFSLYFLAIRKNFKAIFKNEELRFYLLSFATASVLLTINLTGPVYSTVWQSLRYGVFQAGSVITTTCFHTADFNLWPVFSQIVLLLLMFFGASAGSTAGGLKCVRVLLLFKIIKREAGKILHPRSVQTVKLNGKGLDEDLISGVKAFFFVYICLFAGAVLIVSIEGKDIVSTVAAVAASLNNVGPAIGLAGPTGSYADFSVLSKLTLAVCMIAGRLEIYPILLLCFPSFWKKVNI